MSSNKESLKDLPIFGIPREKILFYNLFWILKMDGTRTDEASQLVDQVQPSSPVVQQRNRKVYIISCLLFLLSVSGVCAYMSVNNNDMTMQGNDTSPELLSLSQTTEGPTDLFRS